MFPQNTKPSRKYLGDFIFIIIGIACVVSWYFYKPQIVVFWHNGVRNSQELSDNSWNKVVDFWNSAVDVVKNLSMPSLPTMPSFGLEHLFYGADKPNEIVKDCGVATAPNLNKPSSYENNSVLNCLGSSASHCVEAKAVLKDDLFPTVFQVIKNKDDTCNFKLSYSKDSSLVSTTGKKLANQYVSCPLGIVKAIDENNPESPVFSSPSLENLDKYASQIYFYGTLGLFMESNVDKSKIKSLGCVGSYIDSVVASYNKAQSQ